MRFSASTKFFIITVLTVMLSHVPNVAAAEIASNQMVPTEAVVADLSRAQTEAKVLNYLSKSEVQQKLIENGVSPDEASARLASLSDQELKNLSVQIDKAQYGGDILFAILIVVLIIYLIKRI
jgi:hypothetical protein